ncbi:MAG: YkgJ family cysteine cluster protein [Desulfovibrio sp.]
MLTLWSVRSVWRRLLCLVLRREPRVLGRCLQCGRCCREIVLCHDGRWITSLKRFRELLERDPEYERLEPRERDEAGRILFRCSWLGADGRCTGYEDRLPLCRNHPSPGLWLRGVDLPRACGYRLSGPELFGFLRRRHPNHEQRFERVLDLERDRAKGANALHGLRSRETDEES